jgi:putative DNA primase/helicase
MMASQKRTSPAATGLGYRTHNQSHANAITRAAVECTFAEFARNQDFRTEACEADGDVHRVPAPGDRHGERNGWYVLHLGTFPTGILGNWKTGEKFKWRLRSDVPSIEERQQLDEDIRQAKWLREEQEAIAARAAKEKAHRMWAAACDAEPSHTYLLSKGSRPIGIRQLGNLLLVPMRDVLHNTIVSLQTIDSAGKKRFLTGGHKRAMCHLIGGPIIDVVAVAEGYATAVSIHDATAYPVAIAFDAGNLKPVAQSIRARFPDAKIIVCADDDAATAQRIGRNPGRYYAELAALAVDGVVALPEFAA